MKTKLYLLKKILPALICIPVFVGCQGDEPMEKQENVTPTSGVLILNQGTWGKNNSSLSYYDFVSGETVDDVMNGRLGDTAQDIIVYGGKVYVSITMSGVIWVLSADDLKELKKIEISSYNDLLREPNYLAAYSGKVYATANSGHLIEIDTASLEIDAMTDIGANPEGIAVANGKIYAGNTNGYALPFDSTLSVVNIFPLQEEKRIKVGVNPNRIRPDDNGNLYISYRGNYGYYEPFAAGGFIKLNVADNTLKEIDIPANQDFTIINDTLYYFGVTYNDDWTTNNFFGRYDIISETQINDEWVNPNDITTPYALGIDPHNKDIYIADTDYVTSGRILVFDRNGKQKIEFFAGLNPCKFVFK
ncbi:MAG: hypothetical protein LBS54_06335 [Dysgonamonadaceae bacterium]|nr:hypothetical protein [Dysgonamonadaceae bacterium]